MIARKYRGCWMTVLASALLIGGSGLAQDATKGHDKGHDGKESASSSMTLKGADQKFVMEAAQGGMAEVQMGNLAAQKASSADVKQFGQRMVTDHSKANDELKSVASQKSITLPSDIGAKHKAVMDRLSNLSGEAFDREYMRHMLADHRKDVADFRKEANSGKDADVKAFASKTLPTLEEHLKMSEEINGKVGSNSADRSSKSNKPMSEKPPTTRP